MKNNTFNKSLFICVVTIYSFSMYGQTIESPTIVDIQEDDRNATISWNSLTNIYDDEYDPDKQNGIFSYRIEWGPVAEGFIHAAVTPYRSHMIQPLEPNLDYQARIYALDAHGNASDYVETGIINHDPTRVNDMRLRLNGFFDDMNDPMGPFNEKDWNQSYSGCMGMGKVSQHINNQYHGHNVVASGHCDRAVASSRVRHHFDFTDRTGIIEFDLDGSQKGRQFWYLDLTPADRKRDLTGHISLDNVNPPSADPPFMLRIAEIGPNVSVSLGDELGILTELTGVYENNACGDLMAYCPGKNLEPLINVRKHWRIELSQTHIKISIDGIVVIDGSLVTDNSPSGLEFEIAQVNWLLFSYNTTKENFLLSMIHWDNFGFDAPANYQQSTVIHNYTDGQLGSEVGQTGNDGSIGMVSSLTEGAMSVIPIPDQLEDTNGNLPISAELMFTIQGGDYQWQAAEKIIVNNTEYNFPKPVSEIASLPDIQLINTLKPYSAILNINPADLITGNNEIEFFLNNPRLLNIHIELTYPIDTAPNFTPPQLIHTGYTAKLMGFLNLANQVGPGIVFKQIGDVQFWTFDLHYNNQYTERWYVHDEVVADQLDVIISGNSHAQLAATGKAKGISHYEIWIDEVPIQTIYVNEDSPTAYFLHELSIDLTGVSNGTHELFLKAFDDEGNPSHFDASGHTINGEYVPVLIDVQNVTTALSDVSTDENSISLYPNPSPGLFTIRGDLSNYHIDVLNTVGNIHQSYDAQDGELTINLQNLTSGMYFIRVTNKTNQQLSLEKIIKI